MAFKEVSVVQARQVLMRRLEGSDGLRRIAESAGVAPRPSGPDYIRSLATVNSRSTYTSPGSSVGRATHS